PSEEAEEQYFEDYQLINNFGEEVAQFFPDYVGYVGDGFYVDGELNRLSIDIPLEFYSKGEVIGFTQYTYGLVQEMLPNHYDLEIGKRGKTKQKCISSISKDGFEPGGYIG